MRKIIHIDMDYFFAQVEERDNPKLKGLPLAIGGLHGGRGVLCTSNYIARKYGVTSAMPTSKALKLCPDLVLVSPNFEKYKRESDLIFDIYQQFTKKIEKLSLDEAYLDVTDCKKFNNDALAIAKEIKNRIYGKTGLTASAGISFNKLLAKIGSDLNKPNGISILRPKDIEKKIVNFPVSKIWGVGKVTQERMHKHGIFTFGDMQKRSKLDLVNMFGDFGATMYLFCRGQDEREVVTSGQRKSLSVENTFGQDLDSHYEILTALEDTYTEMKVRLENHANKLIKNIFVKIKYNDFSTTTIESPLPVEFSEYKQLFLERFEPGRKVRLLGTGVKFYGGNTCENQLDFFL